MAVNSLIVQCLSDGDRRAAEEVLKKHGPVSASLAGAYVRGFGDENDVRALEERGLVVEQLPTQPGLSWAEAGRPEEPEAEVLAADAGGGPPSPIREVAAAAPEVYLIQLKGPIRSAWKRELDRIGVDLTGYLPDFAFKAPLTDRQRRDVETLGFVGRVLPYAPPQAPRPPARAREHAPGGGGMWAPPGAAGVFGMAPPAAGIAGAPAASPAPTSYELRCEGAADVALVAEAMRKDPRITDIAVGRRKIRFACDADSPVLEELRSMPQVSAVDPAPEYELSNDCVRAAIGVEQAEPPAACPWDGTGVLVGVADGGVDERHPDLKNRLAAVIARAADGEPDDPHGHGTHVCGIIAGDGTASGGKLRGVAPGARLVVQSLRDRRGKLSGLPLDLGDLFQEAYDRGVRIHNNSWGTIAEGRYSIDSHEVDQFVYDHPDFLVVFSTGNDGAQVVADPPDPLGRIGLQSLRSPAAAKNALTVGASCSNRTDGPYAGKTWRAYPGGPQSPLAADEPICGDVDCLAAFSGRGPSDDERVKPDVVAPGTVVVSARSAGSALGVPYEPFAGHYMYLSGTSMAAPVVAGAAAIVRQYFAQERGHAPSAALLKAALINGAVWIDRDTLRLEEVGQPNFHQGFGRIDLRRTLPFPGDPSGFQLRFADVARDADEALNKGDARRGGWGRTLGVEAGLPLRVTLAWTDRPNKGLQQDLDLVVVTPAGKRLLGNHALKRPSWQKTDHRNNVEQVVIEAPEPGEYRVHVLAYNTPFENQGFGLVATGKLTTDWLP